MDVKSFYNNISNHESIEAVKEKLKTQSDKPLATKVTTKFLFLISALSFVFNGITYLQIKSCAIATTRAQSYTNIFIGKFESTHIFSCINDKIITYFR